MSLRKAERWKRFCGRNEEKKEMRGVTDFEKIKQYYHDFDEKNRLKKSYSGRLEYERTINILEENLPKKATILDLGGAAGVYSFFLAKKGYRMYLADLSEDLINLAKKRKEEQQQENIISCDVVNAVDLSRFLNEQFDVVLLFGPLYHLLEKEEREKCLKEVNRVLKKNALVFASYIPYLSGSIAIVDRYFKHPDQVDQKNLREVFFSGKFNNISEKGFQEGYYPSSKEIKKLFEENGFDTFKIVSVRSFGYEKEDFLYQVRDNEMFDNIIQLIKQTSEIPEIIEMCGHAIYIGKKNKSFPFLSDSAKSSLGLHGK